MEQLDAYLREQQTPASEFAKRIGVSDPYLSKIRRGVFRPSLEVAVRIERVTGGAVSASSWIEQPSSEGEAA